VTSSSTPEQRGKMHDAAGDHARLPVGKNFRLYCLRLSHPAGYIGKDLAVGVAYNVAEGTSFGPPRPAEWARHFGIPSVSGWRIFPNILFAMEAGLARRRPAAGRKDDHRPATTPMSKQRSAGPFFGLPISKWMRLFIRRIASHGSPLTAKFRSGRASSSRHWARCASRTGRARGRRRSPRLWICPA
jgi:hypothetical protein